MKFNTMALLAGVITVLFCTADFFSRLPDSNVDDGQTDLNEEVTLNMPLLKADNVEFVTEEFASEQQPEDELEEDDTPEEIKRRGDEVRLGKKLLRMVAVFENEDQPYAIVEQRNMDSGEGVLKIQLTIGDRINGFRVVSLNLKQMTLERHDRSIVFEMYKKPQVVEG